MKRTKFAAALAVLTLLTTLTGCGQAKEADGALEPVTLNEVAHSIFYAPQYAAIELGRFHGRRRVFGRFFRRRRITRYHTRRFASTTASRMSAFFGCSGIQLRCIGIGRL